MHLRPPFPLYPSPSQFLEQHPQTELQKNGHRDQTLARMASSWTPSAAVGLCGERCVVLDLAPLVSELLCVEE